MLGQTISHLGDKANVTASDELADRFTQHRHQWNPFDAKHSDGRAVLAAPTRRDCDGRVPPGKDRRDLCMARRVT